MPFTMTVRPPFTLPLIDALHDRALLERVLELVPGREALGLVARQPRLAVAVFERLDRDADEIAGLDFDLAAVVREFFDRDDSFRTSARR